MLTKKKYRTTGLKILLVIFLSSFAIIQLYPFIWLVLLSLKSNTEIYGGNIAGIPNSFLWINYKNALLDGKIGLYLFNSFLVTSITIVITLSVSSMAAYALSRMRWKFSGLVLIVFLLGMMIPIHATLLPLFIIFKNMGILNSYWSLILPYVGFSIPISIYILTGFMQTIPKEMEESAFMDGAGVISSFFSIILPIVKPALVTVAIFTFLNSWNELMFAITFISKTQFKTLTVGLQSMVGQYATQWGPVAAGLVISTIPTLLIYSLLSKEITNGFITTGAVKG